MLHTMEKVFSTRNENTVELVILLRSWRFGACRLQLLVSQLTVAIKNDLLTEKGWKWMSKFVVEVSRYAGIEDYRGLKTNT